jgi:hypothetical protein
VVWVVLDSNVVAELCRVGSRGEAIAKFLAQRGLGSFYVVPQFITEAEQAPKGIADQLLKKAMEVCKGVFSRDAKEMLLADLTNPNPYGAAANAEIIPSLRLREIKKTRQEDDVRAFLQDQMLGYDGLRKVLPEIDRILRKGKVEELTSFRELVEQSGLDTLRAYLDEAIAKGYLKRAQAPEDLNIERLWNRGFACRLITLMMLANEYRTRKGLRTKGEGCLTDGRYLIEAAYADELITMDGELVECGKLINEAGFSTLRFTHWASK